MHALSEIRSTLLAIIASLTATAAAQPGPDGFDWVTIGSPGNRGWDRGEVVPGTVNGRGAVDYAYRLSRLETDTQHWMDFVNLYTARPDAPAAIHAPEIWGAEEDPDYAGPGVRYRLNTSLQQPGLNPVGGISWRQAAMYCNILHNGGAATGGALSAIADGAYDKRTFGYDSQGLFTDQRTHSPGARVWISTLDEWMKAAYFSPATNRWNLYPNGSDTPLDYGLPAKSAIYM